MITKLFVDIVFDLIESLLGFLNYDASFFAEMIDIASSHLDTIVNVLKTVLYIVPSGVLLLIPYVIALIILRIAIALFWFLVDLWKAVPLV